MNSSSSGAHQMAASSAASGAVAAAEAASIHPLDVVVDSRSAEAPAAISIGSRPQPFFSSTAKHFIAGATSGMLSKLVEYPGDTLKTRLQTEPGCFRGAWHCFRDTVERRSLLGLYQGVAAPLVGATLENAIAFTAYSAACSSLYRQTPFESTISQVAVSGGLSGLVVAFWMTPVELIKCRMQSQVTAGRYTSTLHCFRDSFASSGLKGLFRGHSSTIVREVPGSIVYFSVYEAVVRNLDEGNRSMRSVMAAGLCGGVSYWTVCFPADVVKSRLQTGTSGSFLPTLVSIFRNEGFAALYRGLGITIARAAPSTALVFLCYEAAMEYLP